MMELWCAIRMTAAKLVRLSAMRRRHGNLAPIVSWDPHRIFAQVSNARLLGPA